MGEGEGEEEEEEEEEEEYVDACDDRWRTMRGGGWGATPIS